MTTNATNIQQETASHAALQSAETLHECFHRAREAAKTLRGAALLLEIVVFGITGYRVLSTPEPGLLPLVIVFVTLLEVVTRHVVRRLQSYGQGCRRLAMRAYAQGEDVSPALAGDRRAELPDAARVLTRSGKGLSLSDYYQCADVPKGDERLRAICTHSAFFSSRLMGYWSAVLIIVLIIVGALGVTMLYYLAVTLSVAQPTRDVYVDALLSVVWSYAAIRVVEAVLETRALKSRFQRVFELLRRTKARGAELEDLVAEYDFDRADGVEAPTFLYRLFNARLQRDWNLVSAEFRR
jgi:hypothetical protein